MSCCGGGPVDFTTLDAFVGSLRGEVVTEEEHSRRREICQDCAKHFPSLDGCLADGATLPLKRPYLRADCPEGYWPAVKRE